MREAADRDAAARNAGFTYASRRMSSLPLIAALLVFAAAPTEGPMSGRLVDARSGSPIANARIAIVGERGSVRTDDRGRFEWPVTPPLPVLVIVVLPDGRVARPIHVAPAGGVRELTLRVEPALAESVVVTGAAPTIDSPAASATTLLTRGELELRHPATVSQALDGVPGVSAVAEGQGAVPAIRGLARGRTLVLVDGSRAMTERRAGANASFLDPGVIRTLEVARGPGSVAYGSDAFGGVIAARTRGPDHDDSWRMRFAGTAGWAVPERRGEIEVSRGYGAGGVLVGVRARDFDDYESPAGTVTNSGWRDRGLRARWEHTTESSVWSVGWQSDQGRALGRPRSDSDVMLATSPIEDSHRLAASYERRAFAGMRNIRVNGLAAGWRQRTEQERVATSTRPRNIERADLSSREVELRLTAERLVRGARLHVGSDVQRRAGFEALDTTLAFDPAGALASETAIVSVERAHRTAAGLFAESESQLAARVRVSGGLRLDTVRSTNDGGFFGDRSASNTALAGLVAATLTPTARLTVTAQAARGFRDPSLSDRFYRGPVGRGFVQGNPDLKPERSAQFDLTARYIAGRVQLAAAGYHYRIDDLVERYSSTANLFLVRNRGEAELQGMEVEAQAVLRRGFTVSATAETSRGRDRNDRAPLDDVAPAAASLALRYGTSPQFSSYVRLKVVGAHREAGPTEVPTRRYNMVDAAVRRRLTRHLDLVGTLRNLLNESYESSAGPRWVWAPGRHGSLTVVAAF